MCLTIGKYNDRVSSDVVPMEVTHILSGRPWQYDTKVVRDGFANKISFQHHDQEIILEPLSPREVCDDQIRMRVEPERERFRFVAEGGVRSHCRYLKTSTSVI